MYGYAIERGSVVYFAQEAYNDWSSIWDVLRQKAPQGSLNFSVCAAMTTVDVHACVSVSFLPSQNVPPALPALLRNPRKGVATTYTRAYVRAQYRSEREEQPQQL